MLTRRRSGAPFERWRRAKLIEAATGLGDIQEQLMEIVETETAVKIFAARNMPQASAAQRAERQAAIQLALQAAADVPLEVMRLCARGLKHAEAVAAHSFPAASSDVQLGGALLHAAFSGARANLEARISSLTDPQYISSVVDEIARLGEEAIVATRATERILHIPPA
jgi:methenyltetrahydrofolate cyclohydrolase